MPRGGLVDNTGRCIAVVMAASPLNNNYESDGKGNSIAFIPDTYCNVGDHWTGSAWLYSGTTPPAVTANQARAAFADAGFTPQLNTAIAGATAANQNIWNPPGITAADAVITAAALAIPLTAAQVRSLLSAAITYPP
jgi:hypothetical protein